MTLFSKLNLVLAVTKYPCGQLVTCCAKLKGQLDTCDELVMCRVDR